MAVLLPLPHPPPPGSRRWRRIRRAVRGPRRRPLLAGLLESPTVLSSSASPRLLIVGARLAFSWPWRHVQVMASVNGGLRIRQVMAALLVLHGLKACPCPALIGFRFQVGDAFGTWHLLAERGGLGLHGGDRPSPMRKPVFQAFPQPGSQFCPRQIAHQNRGQQVLVAVKEEFLGVRPVVFGEHGFRTG